MLTSQQPTTGSYPEPVVSSEQKKQSSPTDITRTSYITRQIN